MTRRPLRFLSRSPFGSVGTADPSLAPRASTKLRLRVSSPPPPPPPASCLRRCCSFSSRSRLRASRSSVCGSVGGVGAVAGDTAAVVAADGGAPFEDDDGAWVLYSLAALVEDGCRCG